MKLFNDLQIKEWDNYTIQHEPISSIQLMERAANACTNWIHENFPNKPISIFCGTGNNGGDGLAIARQLHQLNHQVEVYWTSTSSASKEDFDTNLQHLKAINTVNIIELNEQNPLPEPTSDHLIIDALLGIGLNRPINGFLEKLINHLNRLPNTIVSIDLPTGLQSNHYSGNSAIIKGHHTLSFQIFKIALLVSCNAPYFGEVQVLNIGLDAQYQKNTSAQFELIDSDFYLSCYRPRNSFAHKGNFGHALIIAGSYGKMGAAVLATKACLRAGAGLVTAHLPQKAVDIMQISAPEAMCEIDEHTEWVTSIAYTIDKYAAIAIGPGIGTNPPTQKLLWWVLKNYNRPLVIDADALNILSENSDWLSLLPPNSIITPHVKEFTRLFGEHSNDFEKIETALKQAATLKIIIALKGHHTFIACPDGKGFFNSTGNAGMATGGCGDVLTGIITGLLAQGYEPVKAALMGVYLHGRAGDKAADIYGMEALIAGDLIQQIRVDDNME